ncbi:hypothetical protein ACFLT9_06395 [Acidobacteriota bacterium]
MRHIELIGAPGCGKTTLFRLINDFFSGSDQVLTTQKSLYIGMKKDPIHYMSRKILEIMPPVIGQKLAKKLFRWSSTHSHYASRFLRNNRDLWDIVQESQDFSDIPASHKQKIREWIFDFVGYYEFLEENLADEQSVIFDEGFTQKAVSLFVAPGQEPNWNILDSYIEKIPSLKLLVYVDSEKENCLTRINSQNKGRIRMNDMDSQEIEQFIELSIKVCRYVVEAVRQKNRVDSIIRVDNNVSINESKDRLQQKLKSIFG